MATIDFACCISLPLTTPLTTYGKKMTNKYQVAIFNLTMLSRRSISLLIITLLVTVFQPSLAFFEHESYDYGDDGLIFDVAELAKQRQAGMAKMVNMDNPPELNPYVIEQMVQVLTGKLVAEQVEMMQKSDFCPPDFTDQMCQQLRQKGSFYLWLHKLRKEAILKIGKKFPFFVLFCLSALFLLLFFLKF